MSAIKLLPTDSKVAEIRTAKHYGLKQLHEKLQTPKKEKQKSVLLSKSAKRRLRKKRALSARANSTEENDLCQIAKIATTSTTKKKLPIKSSSKYCGKAPKITNPKRIVVNFKKRPTAQISICNAPPSSIAQQQQSAFKIRNPSELRRAKKRLSTTNSVSCVAARKAKPATVQYVISDQNHPDGVIPFHRQELVQEVVEDALCHLILSRSSIHTNVPCFQIYSCYFEDDFYIMNLSTDKDVDALRRMVDELPELWAGARLQLVPRDRLTDRLIYSFVVQGRAKSCLTEEIIYMLGVQNQGLQVRKWMTLQREEISDGCNITVVIDRKSELVLGRNEFRAFLHKTIVDFKAVRRWVATNSSNNSTPLSVAGNITLNDQLYAKPFGWLGKWQSFTTFLNKGN